jgi:hypothetical protein
MLASRKSSETVDSRLLLSRDTALSQATVCTNSCLLLVHSSDTPAVTTAVYSTCGLGVGIFCIAALLSLPKQFMLIYIGVLVEQTDKGGPPLFFSFFFFHFIC